MPVSDYGCLYPLYAQTQNQYEHMPDVSPVSEVIHFCKVKHRLKSWSEQKLIILKIMQQELSALSQFLF